MKAVVHFSPGTVSYYPAIDDGTVVQCLFDKNFATKEEAEAFIADQLYKMDQLGIYIDSLRVKLNGKVAEYALDFTVNGNHGARELALSYLERITAYEEILKYLKEK